MIKSLQDIISTDIFTLLELDHLPQEKKEEVYQDAFETIMNRSVLRITDGFSSEDIEAFKQAGSESPEALTQFLGSKQIDLEQIVSQETLAYKLEMASLSEALRQDAYNKT